LSQLPVFILESETGMNVSKLSPKLIVAILIVIIFGVSLIFRLVLAHHQVFNDGWVKFTSIDAYFYQRIVDSTAVNFPHIMNFDPYFIFPGGRVLTDIFFPEWLIAGFAWLFGMGAPTQHTINVVSVFFPAIFAALTVIPVYFIGKTLFNRWVGVIAAGLIAVFPGEFLGRSILGFNDTPAIEVLLTTTFLCFAILAVKAARERELTFEDVLRRDRSKCLRPVIYSVLAGLFLGLYLLSWQGALLFVFIFALYLVVQAVRDHLRQRSVDNLGIVGGITFLVALIIFFRFSPSSWYLAAMVLAFLIPVGLAAISRVMAARKLGPFSRPFYYPVALVVIGGIALGAFYLINPDLLTSMFSRFHIFAPSGATGQTTIELQSFLDPSNTGTLTTSTAWSNFNTSFFLGPWWLILGIFASALLGLFNRYYLRGSAIVSWFVFLVPAAVVTCVFAGFTTNSANISKVMIFPGLALISLAVLVYVFIRRNGAGESYVRSIIRVVAILAVIMAELLLYGYGYHALSFVPLVFLFALLFLPGDGQKNWLLLIIWTLTILALTLPSRRYAYYLVVNIALLSAYLCWEIVWLAGIRRLGVKLEEKQEKERYYVEAPKKRNYYEILGITQSASIKEIKKAFRSFTHKYHPDINRSPEIEEKFKEINEAYEVLSNPGRRAAYDRSRPDISKSKQKPKKKESRRERPGAGTYIMSTALTGLALFFLVFYPNIIFAKDITAAEEATYAPSDAWISSMVWLKDNTPEPFGDADAYYRQYEAPPPGETFDYPPTAYGVTSWWDYGYWILKIAHRMPSANPAQDPAPIINVANLFLSEDSIAVQQLMEEMGSSYVILDNTITRGKFWAVATWADQPLAKYSDVFYIPYQGQYVAAQLYYLAYYNTLAVRLYNFDGKAVEAKPTVVTYTENVSEGTTYKLVSDYQQFDSYQEALDYINSQESGNHVIVGLNPFVSPVSLEAVADFELVHVSEQGTSMSGVGFVPEVKIFAYTGP
jgi:oligosaccharyl transferase (archaeosortase A-associated)